jgi:probable HAF family extracellular repeat protein
MESIPPLGGSKCYPTSINNRGQVVGSAETGAVEEYGEIEYHAFIWERGRLTDLNKLIPRASGWTLLSAISINDHGQIVGYGNKGCFLLTPIHAK